jgi:hypothetical protein
MISSLCLSMIFPENRFPLLQIMLQGSPRRLEPTEGAADAVSHSRF